LERRVPAPEKRGRVICVAATEGDEAGVQQLLEAEGHNPDNGDRAIVTYFVSPSGRPRHYEPPYVERRLTA
jgi:hypothetical protein